MRIRQPTHLNEEQTKQVLELYCEKLYGTGTISRVLRLTDKQILRVIESHGIKRTKEQAIEARQRRGWKKK